MEEILEPFDEEICSEDETDHYGHYDYWNRCKRILLPDGKLTDKITVGELKENLKNIFEKETKSINEFKTKIQTYLANKNYVPRFMWIVKPKWAEQKVLQDIKRLIDTIEDTYLKGLPMSYLDDMIYIETTEQSVSTFIEDFYFPYTLVTENRRLG